MIFNWSPLRQSKYLENAYAKYGYLSGFVSALLIPVKEKLPTTASDKQSHASLESVSGKLRRSETFIGKIK